MRNKYEKQKLHAGYAHIIGCDEVGRGCLAGPVVAAAVILDTARLDIRVKRKLWFHEVNDSKLLSTEQRESLDVLIKSHAIGWGIGQVEREIIDEINIHHASLKAMRIAVESLLSANSHELAHGTIGETKILVSIDGKFLIPGLNMEQEAIVDGDAKILSIAAASIIAKVYRDNLMRQVDKVYPNYKFAQHKGYATTIHRTAIKKFGLTPLHRLSFCGQYL